MTKPMAIAGTRARVGLSGSIVVVGSILLAGCATSNTKTSLLSGAEPLERVVGPHDKVTPGGGRYQVGKPYTIGGKTYVPREEPGLDQTGLASWYGGDYHHGTRTANGEVYDRGTLTAAHKTMPLPSYARVTNLRNGRSIVVRVNDRGPYVGSRLIDISEKTAEMLDTKRFGLGQVRVQYLGRAGLAGSDSRVLAATLRGPGINTGHDESVLVAQADLRPGPRQNIPSVAPTMVASITPPPAPVGAAQASLFGQARATAPVAQPSRSLAFTPTTDAFSFELAGVDARTMRAALLAAKPAASTAQVASIEMPRASGAPMSILPVAAPASTMAVADDEPASGLPARTSSYSAEDRIGLAHKIFAGMSDGERLAALID